MANRIDEESGRFSDPNDLNSQIREYIKIKQTMAAMETRQDELKAKLYDALDNSGYEDDKGNIQLELESDVDGVYRLEKQRRTKRKLDEARAEQLLSELGLTEEIYELKPVINEDALMAAFYEEKISEDQLDEIYPLTVIWALRTIKK